MVRVLFVAFQIFDNDVFDDVYIVLALSFLFYLIVSKKNTPIKYKGASSENDNGFKKYEIAICRQLFLV